MAENSKLTPGERELVLVRYVQELINSAGTVVGDIRELTDRVSTLQQEMREVRDLRQKVRDLEENVRELYARFTGAKAEASRQETVLECDGGN